MPSVFIRNKNLGVTIYTTGPPDVDTNGMHKQLGLVQPKEIDGAARIALGEKLAKYLASKLDSDENVTYLETRVYFDSDGYYSCMVPTSGGVELERTS